MRYPAFLKEDSTIGVVAMSAGVGSHLSDYEKSLMTLSSNGFNIKETASVRVDNYVSALASVRAKELDLLIIDPEIDMIMCATGGDFCLETLPFLNYESIKDNPKWIMGASDPTAILYVITTALDIATIYGMNACSYDDEPLHECQFNNIEILKGNLITQKSFPFYEKNKTFSSKKRELVGKVKWDTLNGDFNVTGRIIGGCVDVLRNILGTPYDYTKNFVERYARDGIIWYFDIFSMSSEDFYLALFQMKLAGWFKYTKAIIVGRVMFPQQFNDDFNYKDALLKIFGNIPIVVEADIGHVFPKMTIINGSISTIYCQNGKGSIQFELK